MAAKRITIRFSESEFQTVQARAAAAKTTVSEVVRALAVSGGSGANSEGLAEAIASTLTSIAERIEAIESESGSAATDLSSALQKIEALAASQARTERAIGSLIDAVEKLQNSAGYRPQPSPQNVPTNSQTGAQTSQQTGSAASMSFTAWKLANPLRDGESPAEFNARARAEYVAAGGRL